MLPDLLVPHDSIAIVWSLVTVGCVVIAATVTGALSVVAETWTGTVVMVKQKAGQVHQHCHIIYKLTKKLNNSAYITLGLSSTEPVELQKCSRITIKQFDKAVKVFKFCTLMYYAY